MSTGKALLGVLAGIAAGAAIGVIFAPGKGSDTRKNISKRGEDLANAIRDKIDKNFEDLINSIDGKVKKTKVQSEEHASEVSK